MPRFRAWHRRRCSRATLWLLVWEAAFAAALAAQAPASPLVSDSVLQGRLQGLVDRFHGRVGLYVRHLSTGRAVAINADEL
ncbi:MAG: hypothetical protein PVH40_08735, partial [Gemmatimonadales bacterium]